jgi:hypothetical protein
MDETALSRQISNEQEEINSSTGVAAALLSLISPLRAQSTSAPDALLKTI